MRQFTKEICEQDNSMRRWAMILIFSLVISLLAACVNSEKAPAVEPISLDATKSTGTLADSKFGSGFVELASEKEANPELEQTIIEALQIPDEEALRTLYLYNYVDLNDDGMDEILALLIGPYTSGSGGSTAMHILQNSDGMQVNQIFTLMNEPIIISDKMTKGCHEIVVYRSGGGADGGYITLTSSDGQYQSVNDGTPLEHELEGITGTAIMCNDIPNEIEEGTALYLKK